MSLQTQHTAAPMLICDGDDSHSCPVPLVNGHGATGPVLCQECGEPMALVDLLMVTASQSLTWATLSGESNKFVRRYWS